MAITDNNLLVHDIDNTLTKVRGALILSSPNFQQFGEIPIRHRYDYGENVSPELKISGAIDEIKSFVLTLEDLDHPEQSLHWVVWNIPGSTRTINEGQLPPGAIEGKNDLTENGYYGMCPLQYKHHYKFSLYGLDCNLNIGPDIERENIWQHIENHIVDVAELHGYCVKEGEFILE